MNIDLIELFHVALPRINPLDASGERIEAHESVLLAMHSADDVGWGEASPGSIPVDTSEWAAAAFLCLRDLLGPRIVGRYYDSAVSLQQRIGYIRENQSAKSALDMAWWDLHARRKGEPLHRLLGSEMDQAPLAAAVDVAESIDTLISKIGNHFEEGSQHVTIRIRPGWDVEVVRAVRQVFPSEVIRVDGDGAYSYENMELFFRLEDFGPSAIEQPFDANDLVAHAMLQDSASVAVCLDQSVTSLSRAEQAIDLKSCRAMNVQPGRVGGITPAREIAKLCSNSGIDCHYGGRPQTSLGARGDLAFALSASLTSPVEMTLPHNLFTEGVAAPPSVDVVDGKLHLTASGQPGIGISPDSTKFEPHIIATARTPS